MQNSTAVKLTGGENMTDDEHQSDQRKSEPSGGPMALSEAKKAKSRARASAYYRDHREEVLEKRRVEYQAKKQAAREYVSDEAERAKMRADPRLALREKVVCLECWEILPGGMLNDAHPKLHGMTVAAYKAVEIRPGVPRYSKKTALVSQKMAATLSARRRADIKALAERLKEQGKLAGKYVLEKLRSEGKGRSTGLKSLAARLSASQRKRGVARGDLTAVPSFEIARRWLLENQTTSQIAEEAGLSKEDIHQRRLYRIFGVHPRCADRWSEPAPMVRVHGEIVTDAWLDRFLERFGGLHKSELAQALGLPGDRLYSIGRRRKNLALVPRSAQRLIGAEREMLKILLCDKGSQPRNFCAVIPDLAERIEMARQGIARLRDAVGHEERLYGEDGIIEDLCRESQRAVSRGELGSPATRILLWMPEILSWLKNNGDKLDRKSSALALEFMAADYYAKSWVIQRGSTADCQPTEPDIIYRLIATNFHFEPRPGRPAGSFQSEESKRYFEVGLAVDQAIPRFEELRSKKESLPRRIRKDNQKLHDELRAAGFSEAEIEAGASARSAKIAARHFVAKQQELGFGAVAEYHKVFTRSKK
jgi:hypothetical protein